MIGRLLCALRAHRRVFQSSRGGWLIYGCTRCTNQKWVVW